MPDRRRPRSRKRPDRVYDRHLDGEADAQLIADELVRLEAVETISHETVRQTLKKTM